MLTTTLSVPDGEKVALPLATKSPFAVRVPVNAPVPVTDRLLFIVVVPEEPLMLTALAPPPILTVVVPELKRLPEELVVVIEPPLTAIVPAVVTFPVRVLEPSTVRLPLVWITPADEIVVPVEE